ncbi:MAG: triose-phosphate isomerase [Blastocatellia bacterium]|nr:triose-phosphate isomerase [Blastocatellia bacterium]MCS7157737.1 triose-phosphate isomerase [Blastocatellia bacterium]MCX7752002.1 triose-phosphate isomerase [Blastocatellia bacterium]MDW8167108.1 triose-phosphate isomerase [Acidobacteriota bacterium]MDW8257212.1 triose-phosphate isomerase [Acidobacteriota bacterium]
MRKPVIAGNWKMYKLVAEAVQTVAELRSLVASVTHCEVVVAPPFTALWAVAQQLEGSNIQIAAQDVCDVNGFGARTGEISALMLRDVGCRYVIIGHSERRQFYGETDELVRRKISAALEAGLSPIVCVGETLQEREAGRAEVVVKRQVEAALSGLRPEEVTRLLIAYEPVWAIGTGHTASPEQAQTMHAYIRQRVVTLVGEQVAEGLRILYGGSVRPDNIRALMAEPDIDGALVGGASLDPRSFSEIVYFL